MNNSYFFIILGSILVVCSAVVLLFSSLGREEDQVVLEDTVLMSEAIVPEMEPLPTVIVEEESPEESPLIPLLRAEVQGAGIDVFVVNGGRSTAGRDSRTGEVLRVKDVLYREVSEDLKEIKVFGLSGYSRTLEVFVVGLDDTEYAFAGTYLDDSGEIHDFSYTAATSEQSVDIYVFNFSDGSIQVTHKKYDSPAPYDMEKYVEGCDTKALEFDLLHLLEKQGWSTDEFPVEDIVVTREEKYFDDTLPLPFGVEGTCVVSIRFVEEFQNELPQKSNRSLFIGDIKPSELTVEVGGEKFAPQLADGPMSTKVAIPIATDDDGLRWLELSSGTSVIPINFPTYYVCLCANTYEAKLTEVMYPEE
ncbi:hypothetical protein H6786_02695 [Candidatus Nomurabacteria bacterium]|nr:hypothetical protein [Candidatus Nomurabacteria bacterium]